MWPILVAAVDPEYSPPLGACSSAGRQNVWVLVQQNVIGHLKHFTEEEDANLYVLLGDYGAGKTTVLNYLMFDLAKRKLEHPYDESIRLPLLINLRDYNKVPDFAQLIRSFLVDQAEMGDINARLFRRLNDTGHFILLLDGFDEMLARVTKPDRRRCFLEIAEFIGSKSKVVLTGRPGYFPEHKEFAEVLTAMNKTSSGTLSARKLDARVACLQLMDDSQVEDFIATIGPGNVERVRSLMFKQPGILELARRPVLANMIIETASMLHGLGPEELTPRRLYEIYTNRWMQIEEDKGAFRILIDPDQKSTFVRYLAMQMHLSGTLSIHYSELDRRIASYFNLESAERMDHFSHDVRTCSFLNRTDQGEYRFIHKSFMEYFAACEFERLDSSPFAEQFDKPLTNEMLAFLDFTKLPPEYYNCWHARSGIRKCVEDLVHQKDNAVKEQEFALAARIRDIMKAIRDFNEVVSGIFSYMKKQNFTKRYAEVRQTLTSLTNDPELKKDTVKTLTDIIEIHMGDLGRSFTEIIRPGAEG